MCTCANVTLLSSNLVLDYVTGRCNQCESELLLERSWLGSGTQAGGLLGFLVGAVAHFLGTWTDFALSNSEAHSAEASGHGFTGRQLLGLFAQPS